MLLLIVNADDLGYSSEVNQAIFQWMERGRLSSASLLANGPCIEEALGRLSEFPRCSFGVHLNLEEFSPLRPDPALSPLMDGAGRLTRRLRATRRTPSLLRAIYAEWCAQIPRGAPCRLSRDRRSPPLEVLPYLHSATRRPRRSARPGHLWTAGVRVVSEVRSAVGVHGEEPSRTRGRVAGLRRERRDLGTARSAQRHERPLGRFVAARCTQNDAASGPVSRRAAASVGCAGRQRRSR